MSGRLAIAVAALVVGTLLVISSTSERGEALPQTARVVVVAAPYLDLRDLTAARMPHLVGALRRSGAVGAMSPRASVTRPDPVEGYLALGSGVRSPTVRGAGVVQNGRVLAIAALRAAHRADYLGSRPGALGEALRRAGRTSVLIEPGIRSPLQPGALAVMDAAGRFDAINPPLGGLPATTYRAMREHDLTVIDVGDGGPPPTTDARHRNARRIDGLIGALAERVPADTLLLLASVSPAPSGALTPSAAVGPGVASGELVSRSTRRVGIVTLGDIAPTILQALSVDIPAGMVGRPLRAKPGPLQLGHLRELDRLSEVRASAFRPTLYVFGAGLLGLLVMTLLVVSGRRPPPRGLGAAAAVVAAIPLGSFLARSFPVSVVSTSLLSVLFTVLCAVIVALLAHLRVRDDRDVLLRVLVATAAVLLLDGGSGGHLHVAAWLGYSLPGGGRFYGLPNSTFALVGSASLIAAGLLVARHGATRRTLTVIGTAFAVVALVDALPALGSDVGGLLTITPIFAGTLLVLAGHRLRARDLAGLAAVTLALLVASAVLDLLRPGAGQTHLGRLVTSVDGDGLQSLGDTISRKESANLHLLLHSPWLVLAPIVIVGAWQALRLTTAEHGALRVCVLATFAFTIVGFALNDSGAIVVVLSLAFLVPLTAVLGGTRTRH